MLHILIAPAYAKKEVKFSLRWKLPEVILKYFNSYCKICYIFNKRLNTQMYS